MQRERRNGGDGDGWRVCTRELSHACRCGCMARWVPPARDEKVARERDTGRIWKGELRSRHPES